MKQHKLMLMKQRKEYIGKQNVLKADLEKLMKQKRELLAEKRTDNEPIIQKNSELQVILLVEVNNNIVCVLLFSASKWHYESILSFFFAIINNYKS